MFGISQALYDELFSFSSNGVSSDKLLTSEDNKSAYSLVFQDGISTTPATEEDVDQIRENAPTWFTSGNRLVTKTDYEYYLKNNANGSQVLGSDIVDVVCMNNWEYMATFYKWLYQLGVNGKLVQYSSYLGNGMTASPQRYLSKEHLIRYSYFFADSADANNLYLWMKSTNDNFNPQIGTINANQILGPIKLMTAELVVCKALNVMFDICAAPEDYAIAKYIQTASSQKDDTTLFDEDCESYVEVTLDDNAIYVASSIQNEIYDAIVDEFSINACQLGQTVSYSNILQKIYAINGVQRVRTVFKPSDESFGTMRIVDGLSFASWTSMTDFITVGDDLVVSNTLRQLEDFQFPVFNGVSTLLNKIKIIKKSLSTVNTIKF